MPFWPPTLPPGGRKLTTNVPPLPRAGRTYDPANEQEFRAAVERILKEIADIENDVVTTRARLDEPAAQGDLLIGSASPAWTRLAIGAVARYLRSTGTTAAWAVLDASELAAGTIPDARVAQSNVTQHQAALSIAETQIPDGAVLARVAGNESISGDWSFTNKVRIPVVATASLPAAGAAQDGLVLIEDAGAGDRNLIIYAGGERFRIDGGAAF